MSCSLPSFYSSPFHCAAQQHSVCYFISFFCLRLVVRWSARDERMESPKTIWHKWQRPKDNNPHHKYGVFSSFTVSNHWTIQKECFLTDKTLCQYIFISWCNVENVLFNGAENDPKLYIREKKFYFQVIMWWVTNCHHRVSISCINKSQQQWMYHVFLSSLTCRGLLDRLWAAEQ